MERRRRVRCNLAQPTLIQRPANPGRLTNQLCYMRGLIHGLCKTTFASDFLSPVDANALGVPYYYSIIKHPMDLGTIKRRLDNFYYANVQEVINDFQLLLDNCFRFNASDHEVYTNGKQLEQAFFLTLEKMPADEFELTQRQSRAYEAVPKQFLSTVSSAAKGAALLSFSSPAQPAPPPKSASRKLSHHVPPKSKLLQPSQPIPSSMLPLSAGRRGPPSPELRACREVMQELMSMRLRNLAWPFVEPVEADKLGLYDYHLIVRTPMDLGRIRRKLIDRAYENASQFDHDVQQVWENAFLYTSSDHLIHQMALQLKQIYESLYIKVQAIIDSSSKPKPSEDTKLMLPAYEQPKSQSQMLQTTVNSSGDCTAVSDTDSKTFFSSSISSKSIPPCTRPSSIALLMSPTSSVIKIEGASLSNVKSSQLPQLPAVKSSPSSSSITPLSKLLSISELPLLLPLSPLSPLPPLSELPSTSAFSMPLSPLALNPISPLSATSLVCDDNSNEKDSLTIEKKRELHEMIGQMTPPAQNHVRRMAKYHEGCAVANYNLFQLKPSTLREILKFAQQFRRHMQRHALRYLDHDDCPRKRKSKCILDSTDDATPLKRSPTNRDTYPEMNESTNIKNSLSDEDCDK